VAARDLGLLKLELLMLPAMLMQTLLMTVMRTVASPVHVPWRAKLIAGYAKDSWFADTANTRLLEFDDSLWCTADGKIVLRASDNLCQQVYTELHDSPYSGHLGTNKTFKLVTRHYWWPGVTAQVEQHCETCHQCQKL